MINKELKEWWESRGYSDVDEMFLMGAKDCLEGNAYKDDAGVSYKRGHSAEWNYEKRKVPIPDYLNNFNEIMEGYYHDK